MLNMVERLETMACKVRQNRNKNDEFDIASLLNPNFQMKRLGASFS